jgi:hypothetical protein
MGAPDTTLAGNEVMPDNLIAAVAKQAGFDGNDLVIAVAVAIGESGGRPRAMGPKNSNGSQDFGLWQINYPAHAALFDQPGGSTSWIDPRKNAQWARTVWSGRGGSWAPWTVYNSGNYRLHMNRAKTGVDNIGNEVQVKEWIGTVLRTEMREQLNEQATDPISEIIALAGKALDPKTWVSIGLILAGALMLLLVGWRLMKDNVPTPAKLLKGVLK